MRVRGSVDYIDMSESTFAAGAIPAAFSADNVFENKEPPLGIHKYIEVFFLNAARRNLIQREE